MYRSSHFGEAEREKPKEGRLMGIVALTTALVHPFATEVARYPLE
jgi:hypothetical protein